MPTHIAELRAKLNYALSEANLTRVGPAIFENVEENFAMRLFIFLADKPYIQLAELDIRSVRTSTVLFKGFHSDHKLDDEIVDRLYNWLRQEEYPVDRIVRTKRLRALLDG